MGPQAGLPNQAQDIPTALFNCRVAYDFRTNTVRRLDLA